MPWVLLLLATLFVNFGGNLPMGSLPLALSADGSSAAVVSLVMGAALFAALAGSVPIGVLVDRVGRLPTMRGSVVLVILSTVGLAFVHGPVANAAVMALRALALVALVTAQFAYAAEVVPPERRISAVTTLGMIGNLSFATAPVLAVWLWQHGIGREQYAWAGLSILAGAMFLIPLPARHDVRTLRRSRTIVMRSAWLPAIGFSMATTVAGGINGALAVLTFDHRGLANGALIFSAQALTAFALRYPAGRMVDEYGPRVIAIPTAIFQCLGCILAAYAYGPLAVIVAGICFGVAWSAVVPVAVALFFEKSSSTTRGIALGAYNFSVGVGQASGALLAALAAALGPGYALAMMVAALVPLAALPGVLLSTSARAVKTSS